MVRMSARLYPPPRGITQQTGIRLDYPPPWARMPLSFWWAWKRVIQEIKKPREEWVYKQKTAGSMYRVGGVVLGSGRSCDQGNK